MTPVGVVACREFLSTVKRRSYLIVTFGMPFFATLYFGLLALVPAYIMTREGGATVGLVDEAGGLASAPSASAGGSGTAGASRPSPTPAATAGPIGALGERLGRQPQARLAGALLEKMMEPSRFRRFPDRSAALEALRGGAIERFFLLPADYLRRGGIESYEAEGAPAGVDGSRAEEDLERLLSSTLLAGRLPEDLRARIETPIDGARRLSFLQRSDGRLEPIHPDERTARLLIPVAFGIVLLMALMTNAGYLLQGLTEEKENRVIEVILTSVRPHQLLLGKLLGLGAAGLLQLAVWCSVAGFAGAVLAAGTLAYLNPALFLGCLVFFILGFLMIGSLMIGTGALGSNSRESQQLAMIWSLAASLPPLVTWLVLLREPNGLLARALGWFPPTAPVTMMVRLGTGRVPLWDIAVAIVALIAGVALSIRLAAGLLGLGLLMYGRRPTLAEIARHLRRS